MWGTLGLGVNKTWNWKATLHGALKLLQPSISTSEDPTRQVGRIINKSARFVHSFLGVRTVASLAGLCPATSDRIRFLFGLGHAPKANGRLVRVSKSQSYAHN